MKSTTRIEDRRPFTVFVSVKSKSGNRTRTGYAFNVGRDEFLSVEARPLVKDWKKRKTLSQVLGVDGMELAERIYGKEGTQ